MTRLPAPAHTFASDNCAGAHPEVIDAIVRANVGHAASYGDDAITLELQARFCELLGSEVETYPVATGTAANVISLQSMLTRWGAVIAHREAHINTDEGGAPEKIGGMKILPVDSADGKIRPADVRRLAPSLPIHAAEPQVVSLTQSTEFGTIYSVAEVTEIAATAHDLGLTVHMDGARIANAAAALGTSLRALTKDAGVDVLSFGGTKNGAIGAEAVVVLNPGAVRGVAWLRKLDMQLLSKSRFVSAQLVALLTDDLWLRSGSHANAMASRLRRGLERAIADGSVNGVAFTQPTQANGVFATMPRRVAEHARKSFDFHDWDDSIGEVRLLTSFATTEADVDALLAAIEAGSDEGGASRAE